MGRYELFGRALDRCESFLERRFLVALLFSERFSFDVAPKVGLAESSDGIIVGQQLEIGTWRLDFAMKRRGWDGRVAIELDGHRYHDASPELAERDRVRDCDLTSMGWRILRFTSREVTADPIACCQKAIDVVLKLSNAEPRIIPSLGPAIAKTKPLQLTLRALKTGTGGK